MQKHWWFALAGLGLLLSFQAFATKFIKVKVGNVRVMVPIDEKPVATADTVSVYEDSTTLLNILNNDADELMEQVQLTIAAPSDLSMLHGTLVQDGNELSYTPAANAFGDYYDSFDYYLTDVKGNVSETVTVLINVLPVNDAPVSSVTGTIRFPLDEDQRSSFNGLYGFSDIENESLSVVQANATHGSAYVKSFDTFEFIPKEHFSGTDYVDVFVSDGTNITSARWEFNIRAMPDLTKVEAFVQIRNSGLADMGISVIDPDGAPTSVQLEVTGNNYQENFNFPMQAMNIRPDNVYYFAYVLSPAIFDGNYNLRVTGTDESGNVFPPFDLPFAASSGNVPPTAFDDSFSTVSTEEIELTVLANDFDSDVGDVLTIDSVVQAPTKGTYRITSNRLYYTPDNIAEPAEDRLKYRIKDSSGSTAEAFVDLGIVPVEAMPPVQDLVVSHGNHHDVSTLVIAQGSTVEFSWSALPDDGHHYEYRLGIHGMAGTCSNGRQASNSCVVATTESSASAALTEVGSYQYSVQTCYEYSNFCSISGNRVTVEVVSMNIVNLTANPSRIVAQDETTVSWQPVDLEGVHYVIEVDRPESAEQEQVTDWDQLYPDRRNVRYESSSRASNPGSIGTYVYKITACTDDYGCGQSATVDIEVLETLENDSVLTYIYDDFGRLWKVTQNEVVVIEYVYDDAGNRTSVIYRQGSN